MNCNSEKAIEPIIAHEQSGRNAGRAEYLPVSGVSTGERGM